MSGTKRSQQLVLIFGPPAVGKRSVAEALAMKLNFRVLHPDLLSAFVEQFFSRQDQSYWTLSSKLRRLIFEEIAASYTPGFIFTYVWDFNQVSDGEFIKAMVSLFEEKLWKVHFIELEASLSTRLRRNRQKYDDTDTDYDAADAEIMEYEDFLLNSQGKFDHSEKYTRINTTNLSIDQVVEMIEEQLAI